MEMSSLINGKTSHYLEEQSAWDCSASTLTPLITPADLLEIKNPIQPQGFLCRDTPLEIVAIYLK